MNIDCVIGIEGLLFCDRKTSSVDRHDGAKTVQSDFYLMNSS